MTDFRSSRLGLALALSCALTACVVPSGPKPVGEAQEETAVSGGIKAQPVTIKPRASALPVAPVFGASPTPRPSAAATVAPSPSPLPPAPTLSTESKRIQARVENALLAIARVGFNQNRGGLISDKGLGLVSDKGLGVIANNGVGVISNGGGGVISNNGSGYRIRAAEAAVNPAPLADELLFIDRRWPDGSRSQAYTKASDDGSTYLRRLRYLGSGVAVEEQALLATDLAETGVHAHIAEGYTLAHPDGALAMRTNIVRDFDTATGLQTRITAKQGATQVRDPQAGVAIDLDTLVLDAEAGTGSFTYVYANLGFTETGTLTGVKRDAAGNLNVSPFDPLAFYDGESKVVDPQGKQLFTKKQVTDGATVRREYDLGGGLVAVLKPADGLFKGVLNEDGHPVAKLEQAIRADGSVVFSIYFPEQPTKPVAYGYGVTAFAEPPNANPTIPGWQVATVAGAGNPLPAPDGSVLVPGTADGDGATARFGGLGVMVQSRKDPKRYYVADTANHRLRTLTLTGRTAVVAPYVGDGQSGTTDGVAAAARFESPLGLAVGADDTLYVTDGNRVRKVAPDGTVSTLAGATSAGFADKTGTQARFNAPAGLALDTAKNVLYVADTKNHRIRKLDPATGAVGTFAGSGTAATTNGAIASARFDAPLALALDANGALFVLDGGLVRQVAGGQVTTYAGGGSPFKAQLDGPATDGTLTAPTCLAVGPDGQLYVGGRDVRRIGADGNLTSVAGLAAETPGYADGLVTDAAFYGITGLAFADGGWVLAADGTTIRLIAPPAP